MFSSCQALAVKASQSSLRVLHSRRPVKNGCSRHHAPRTTPCARRFGSLALSRLVLPTHQTVENTTFNFLCDVPLKADVKSRHEADSPGFRVKIGTTPLLPVGLEIDLGRADDRLPVKALEDGLVEPRASEVRGVEDVLLLLVVRVASGD